MVAVFSGLSFILSVTAYVLGLYAMNTPNWLHYDSVIDPMDLGFIMVCYRAFNTCSHSDIGLFIDVYSDKGRSLGSYIAAFLTGQWLCIASAILAIPLKTEMKMKSGINFITPVIGFLSVKHFLTSLPTFCYYWDGILALDSDYLHPGLSAVICAIMMILVVMAWLCQIMVAYQSHATISICSTWIGQCLLCVFSKASVWAQTVCEVIKKTYLESEVQLEQ